MMAELARETARDFYYAALFAPAEKREALFTLAAFHGELASVRAKSKQSIAGEVRLQWWQDALTNGEIDHPILASLNRFSFLPKKTLITKAAAHVFDLYDDKHVSKQEMEAYYGETISALMMLNAIVLNEGKPVNQSELAGLAGVNYGLWRDGGDFLSYQTQALALFKECPKNLKPAFLPLILTKKSRDIGDFRKLFTYFMAI